jgi:DNA-binding GntR family transcriptional regulator
MIFKMDTKSCNKVKQYESLRDVAFNRIRSEILSGELKPGERLMEETLSRKIGVSRTPIRESFRKLELEGYIKIVPRKGAIVSIITSKDIKDVLEIRSSLEALAVKLACANFTPEIENKLRNAKKNFEISVKSENIELMVEKDTLFHEIIYLASDNDKLLQLIYNLSEQMHRYRTVYLINEKNRLSIMEEHDLIFDAIKVNDKEKAISEILKHISHQENSITKMITL